MLENQTAEAQAILESLQAPTYNVYYPEELWSEILPGLWQGGTDDADVVNAANRGVEISLTSLPRCMPRLTRWTGLCKRCALVSMTTTCLISTLKTSRTLCGSLTGSGRAATEYSSVARQA